MAKPNVTMKHVAKLADVSVQTVSAVINGKPGISKDTTDRVNEVIRQLGYRPFSVARSLRTGETHTIAMIVSDIANPSFSTMASAVADYVHNIGYTLALYNTHDNVEREASYIRMAAERWVDGLLVVPARDHSESLAPLQAAGIPFVILDRQPDAYQGPLVTLDHFRSGALAAEYLLSLGHTTAGHISGPLRLRLARDRQEGFVETFYAGAGARAMTFESAGWSCMEGYEAAKKLLQQRNRPTALFCASDRLAMGAMLAISEAGYKVPENISIIGLDDIEVTAFQMLPLTTIRQSFQQIGKCGIQLLMELIAHGTVDQAQFFITPELIIRQSTAQYQG